MLPWLLKCLQPNLDLHLQGVICVCSYLWRATLLHHKSFFTTVTSDASIPKEGGIQQC